MNGPDPRWCALIRGSTPPPRPAAAPPTVVDRADYDPTYDPGAPIVCEICGSEMRYSAACKIECRTCGYRRDCSDP